MGPDRPEPDDPFLFRLCGAIKPFQAPAVLDRMRPDIAGREARFIQGKFQNARAAQKGGLISGRALRFFERPRGVQPEKVPFSRSDKAPLYQLSAANASLRHSGARRSLEPEVHLSAFFCRTVDSGFLAAARPRNDAF